MTKVIQFTGLSGAGKTTLASGISKVLSEMGFKVLIIDGDEFRRTHAADLGFSRADRLENITRMANYVNRQKSSYDFIFISAINPFEETRQLLRTQCAAELVYVKCPLEILIQRDTKGLYRRAMLPKEHPEYLGNLTGLNQVFDEPVENVYVIDTSVLSEEEAIETIREKCCIPF